MSRRFKLSDFTRIKSDAKISMFTIGEAGAKASKYGSTRVTEDEQSFDSKLEAKYYRELKLRKAAGEVAWFIRQVPFILEGGMKYRADFLVVLCGGAIEIVDCKGHETRLSMNKRRAMQARYGLTVLLWPSK